MSEPTTFHEAVSAVTYPMAIVTTVAPDGDRHPAPPALAPAGRRPTPSAH
ncbi:hypothetical protein FRACA_120031 [Frankia canadensis]|uniref:Uncharacterized protein n=1 Tax=Frankia canadensis TaxID=1836972 RepID=A0A2I2KJX7_9ACTN|nr:hypothetical protein [Frankia canadensis]SNQ45968.1 hypothetical protein FRACA_120031 [Frankia canadensis]SOU53258.1 hypothetical protein FRACA_120031 [Frankia canadensis]